MVVDAAIVAFTGFFTWRGYRRGLLASFTKLVGFVAATGAAVLGYRYIAGPMQTLGFGEGTANVVGALAIFVGVSALAYLGGRAVTRLLDWTKWGLLNHAGGAAIAGAWSITIVTIALLAISVAPAPGLHARVDGSTLGSSLVRESPRFATSIADTALRPLLESVLPGPERRLAATGDFRSIPAAGEQLFQRLNRVREARGLAVLRWDDDLAAVARSHAADMYRRGYFGHRSPEGLSPGDRLRARDIRFAVTGENLVLALSVRHAHNELMRSRDHRRHVLHPRFDRVGIGVMFGRHGYLVAQTFVG